MQLLGSPPYLTSLALVTERIDTPDIHPFTVACLRALPLRFRSRVTFVVGENGSGKSTLLEGIASACRLPVSGGGREDVSGGHGPRDETPLARALRPTFSRRPRDAYFFRGEYSAHFATLLDQRKADRDFLGDPYKSYGGRSLHTRSHGEGFITLMNHRIGTDGIYLMDEPEAALSPQRQLALLALLADRLRSSDTQFIIATHSPILMTVPDAEILWIERDRITPVALHDTEHYQVTKSVLDSPASFWKHLTENVDD